MRDLTVKQKKFLDKWFDKNEKQLTLFNIMDILSPKDFDILQEMNDTEVLYQNIENYVGDKL